MSRDIAMLLVMGMILTLLVGLAIGFLLGWIRARDKYSPSVLFHLDDLIIMEIALRISKPMPIEEMVIIGMMVGALLFIGGLELLSYIPFFGINETVASLKIACTVSPQQCWPMKH